jgi:hypothetical protein
MRDLGKTIDHIERGMLRGLDRIDRKATLPSKMTTPRPSVRAWHAPVTSDAVYPEQVFRPRTKPKAEPKAEPGDNPKDPSSAFPPKSTSMTQLTLTAKALKITVPLDVAEIARLHIPDNQTRTQLAITCEGKVYTADIATKPCVRPNRPLPPIGRKTSLPWCREN